MSAPKGQTKRSLLNHLNNQLNAIGTNRPLQEWLDQASAINSSIAKALNGMYCGHDGRIHEQVEGLGHEIWLTMGWHTVSTVRVEYAYFS